MTEAPDTASRETALAKRPYDKRGTASFSRRCRSPFVVMESVRRNRRGNTGFRPRRRSACGYPDLENELDFHGLSARQRCHAPPPNGYVCRLTEFFLRGKHDVAAALPTTSPRFRRIPAVAGCPTSAVSRHRGISRKDVAAGRWDAITAQAERCRMV